MCNNPECLHECATSVTKRDKSDIQKTGLRAVKRDGPFFRRAVASRHPTTEQILAKELALLKAEVLIFLNGFISRSYQAESRAMARLRKAAER
jgi:hypothetical protein